MATYFRSKETGEVLDEQQYKAKYGRLPWEKATSTTPTAFETPKQSGATPSISTPSQNLGEKTAGIYVDSAKKVGESVTQGAEKIQKGNVLGGVAQAGLGTAAGVARATFAPIEATVSKVADATGLSDLFKGLMNKGAETKTGSAILDWSEKNPDAARNLMDALTIATAGVGTKAGSGVLGANVGKSLKGFGGAATDVVKAPLKAVRAIDQAATRSAQAKAAAAPNFAVELTAPKMNKALAEQAIRQGSKRVKQSGIFGRTQIVANERDLRVAKSVEDVVSPKKRLIENVDAINRKINETNRGVHEYIKTNKVPFNQNQLRTKLSLAKKEQNLLFAGEEGAEKAYDAVIDEFMSQIGKKDTAGLFEARQGFDKYLRNKMPSLFKKDATGQFINPKDSVRMNAALDVRKAVNQYIGELLPEGNPYKATLQQETDMLEALSRIAEKNAGKISMKNLKILADKHPLLFAAVSAAAAGTAGGVGVGVANAAIND